MQIHSNYPLQLLNSFGFAAFAQEFVSVKTNSELFDAISYANSKKLPWQIIGGGSNIVLRSNLPGLTIQIQILGKKLVRETESQFVIDVGAGENWHDFVAWSLENNYLGLENLALIPGTVGAAPIQNIGAYGVEIKDTFYQLEALEIATGKIKIFTNKECAFGYRNSVFKNKLKGKYIIINVTFKLTKSSHNFNISYGDIKNHLKDIKHPTLQHIADAVISIRKSKLPDPKEIGNSGSFFKNPVIFATQFKKLQEKYPSIPFYQLKKSKLTKKK